MSRKNRNRRVQSNGFRNLLSRFNKAFGTGKASPQTGQMNPINVAKNIVTLITILGGSQLVTTPQNTPTSITASQVPASVRGATAVVKHEPNMVGRRPEELRKFFAPDAVLSSKVNNLEFKHNVAGPKSLFAYYNNAKFSQNQIGPAASRIVYDHVPSEIGVNDTHAVVLSRTYYRDTNRANSTWEGFYWEVFLLERTPDADTTNEFAGYKVKAFYGGRTADEASKLNETLRKNYNIS